jgi:predicted dehydrogenase
VERPDDDRRVRWGIAATGRIAGSMVDALRTLPDAEVVAVGSRSPDTARAFAERFGIPRAHGSYADLHADDEVDVVYVASPHSHHREMTEAALRAGRHVLCEKAFALNASEARSMIETARDEDRFLMEAMWSWFMPVWQEVGRRVASGEIGEVRIVAADFGIPMEDPDGRHRRADLAGGALLDLGIYPLAIARFLLGEPDEVRALGHVTGQGVDGTAGGVLRYGSGAIAVFHTTIDAFSPRAAEVVGTSGTIRIDPPFWHPSAYSITDRDGRTTHVDLPNEGLAHEAAHAMEMIRAGRRESDVVPWSASIAGMELMDEIRRQLGVVYPQER